MAGENWSILSGPGSAPILNEHVKRFISPEPGPSRLLRLVHFHGSGLPAPRSNRRNSALGRGIEVADKVVGDLVLAGGGHEVELDAVGPLELDGLAGEHEVLGRGRHAGGDGGGLGVDVDVDAVGDVLAARGQRGW